MIDLNTLISNALTAAVQQAVAPLNERIATLEKNEEYLTNRIAALENNPAQGVDTSVVAGNYTPISNEQIKVALQEWATTGGFVTRDDVAELIAEAMDDHTSTYDHDDYDSHIGDDDKHFDGDIEDAVRDALSNMTFEVSVS